MCPWRCTLTARALARFEIPRRLRALVRARESSLIGLAALVGAAGGLVVALMGSAVDLLHEVFFHLQHGERLSARLSLDPVLALSVPLLGGIILVLVLAFPAGLAGAFLRFAGRWRRT